MAPSETPPDSRWRPSEIVTGTRCPRLRAAVLDERTAGGVFQINPFEQTLLFLGAQCAQHRTAFRAPGETSGCMSC